MAALDASALDNRTTAARRRAQPARHAFPGRARRRRVRRGAPRVPLHPRAHPGARTAAIVARQLEQAQRDDALDEARALARDLLEARRPPGADTLAAIDRLVARGRAPPGAPPDTAGPLALRAALARADEAMRLVADTVAVAVAALARGAQAQAAAGLRAAARLDRAADREGFEARGLARDYLLDRQRALDVAASELFRDTLLWLALGVIAIPLAVSILRRRFWEPLRALEAGLTQVAEGDLNTEVAVQRVDEIGRLAQHFNAMTRVLRDRAHEQGRFVAAGELLAGVAHEVNNPLMAIAAHAENRLADPTIPEEQRGEMTQILRQARRATKLLRGLLRFVRATEQEVTRVNLNDVVRGALDLVSYRFGVDEITVGGRLDPNLPPVQGDAVKLEQVVVNLLANAIDALRAIKPPRHLAVDTSVADGRASVVVADNGRGVAPEIAPRLFLPFATTKGRRGTGLGLYISRQIARDAGGELALVSPAGPLPRPPGRPGGGSGGRRGGPRPARRPAGGRDPRRSPDATNGRHRALRALGGPAPRPGRAGDVSLRGRLPARGAREHPGAA